MTSHYLTGMQGLGDTVYSRPFVKAAAARGDEVWLTTSWPQLFADLPAVHCVRRPNRLRTQEKNMHRSLHLFEHAPRSARFRPWSYATARGVSITAALERGLPLQAGETLAMDLPDFGPPPVETTRPYIVVRPATVRREWRADNRNPLPGYLRDVAAALRDDFELIGVADLKEGQEWPVQPLPAFDRGFMAGELGVEQLLALVQGAAALLGPVGWLLPVALATGKPLLCIAGGQGGNNGPERLIDPRVARADVRMVLPDDYCRCCTWTHACDRRITRIEDHLEAWRRENDL